MKSIVFLFISTLSFGQINFDFQEINNDTLRYLNNIKKLHAVRQREWNTTIEQEKLCEFLNANPKKYIYINFLRVKYFKNNDKVILNFNKTLSLEKSKKLFEIYIFLNSDTLVCVNTSKYWLDYKDVFVHSFQVQNDKYFAYNEKYYLLNYNFITSNDSLVFFKLYQHDYHIRYIAIHKENQHIYFVLSNYENHELYLIRQEAYFSDDSYKKIFFYYHKIYNKKSFYTFRYYIYNLFSVLKYIVSDPCC